MNWLIAEYEIGLSLGLAILSMCPPAYADCTINAGLFIGTVAHVPFSAEIVSTDWKVLADGSEAPAGSKSIEEVARDNFGRVRIQRIPAKNTGGNPFTLICDPVAGTQTALMEQTVPDMDSSQPRATKIIYTAWVTPAPRLHRGEQFITGWRAGSNKAVQDLGFKTIEGISTQGDRSPILGGPDVDQAESIKKQFIETWSSQEFGSQLLVVRADFDKGKELRTALVNIRQNEPDPALFQIPDQYTITAQPPARTIGPRSDH